MPNNPPNKNQLIEDEFSQETRNTVTKKLGQSLIKSIGSWSFLIINLLLFALWMVLDLHYDLLTFWVSLEAIVLSILILINANQESVSDRSRAIKDYKIDLSMAQRLKRVEEDLRQIKELMEK